MATQKSKKKVPAKSRAAARPAKKALKKPAAARKPVAKAKPVKKAKPAPKAVARKPKPAPKGKPAPKKAAKAASKAKPAAKAAPKPVKAPTPTIVTAPPEKKAAPKRAMAASHRPQNAAVAVQPRNPLGKKPSAPVPRPMAMPLPPGSSLTEDDIRGAPDSSYMDDDQLAFFNERLMQMRSEVLAREIDVKERLHQREVFADPADRASAEEEHWLDLRLRERESLLLKKIDDALRRIRDREYGYCEKTGEPIGIARLLARPTATVCVDIKGQDERAESQYRDR